MQRKRRGIDDMSDDWKIPPISDTILDPTPECVVCLEVVLRAVEATAAECDVETKFR